MLLPNVPLLSVEQIAERSELLILAVPDDELPGLVTYLASSGSITAGQILVHTSGRHGTEVLAPATALGAIGLAIHPAMTFTGMSMDLQRLNGTCFAVTGPAPFIPIAQALVVEMGGEPVHVAEADRALYHAALAHAANHLVTILGQSQQMLASIGIEDPARYMGPLVRAAVDWLLRCYTVATCTTWRSPSRESPRRSAHIRSTAPAQSTRSECAPGQYRRGRK